jgi:hypothetical protein
MKRGRIGEGPLTVNVEVPPCDRHVLASWGAVDPGQADLRISD